MTDSAVPSRAAPSRDEIAKIIRRVHLNCCVVVAGPITDRRSFEERVADGVREAGVTVDRDTLVLAVMEEKHEAERLLHSPLDPKYGLMLADAVLALLAPSGEASRAAPSADTEPGKRTFTDSLALAMAMSAASDEWDEGEEENERWAGVKWMYLAHRLHELGYDARASVGGGEAPEPVAWDEMDRHQVKLRLAKAGWAIDEDAIGAVMLAVLDYAGPLYVRASSLPSPPPIHWKRWGVLSTEGDLRRVCMTEGSATETACGDEDVMELAVYPVDANVRVAEAGQSLPDNPGGCRHCGHVHGSEVFAWAAWRAGARHFSAWQNEAEASESMEKLNTLIADAPYTLIPLSLASPLPTAPEEKP